MLLLLLACANPSADSQPAESETTDSETGSTDTGTESAETEWQTYDVVCEGTETNTVSTAVGNPPPPLVLWEHRQDWYVARYGGSAWAQAPAMVDESGNLNLICNWSWWGDIGGPDEKVFVPDRFVVYVKPL